MNDETNLAEAYQRVVQQSKVDRFEVIDHRSTVAFKGRVYSVRPCRVGLSFQDGGRTLKVFIDDPVGV